MRKFLIIFITQFLLLFNPSLGQQSGRIFLKDGSIIEMKEFTRLQTELYYFQKNNRYNKKELTSVDFIRNYPLEKIVSMTFRYEKGIGTDQFYYQLLIEGLTSNGSRFKKKIRTWDWLEVSNPESGNQRNSEITFFTEKKKLDIVRLEFYQSSGLSQ